MKCLLHNCVLSRMLAITLMLVFTGPEMLLAATSMDKLVKDFRPIIAKVKEVKPNGFVLDKGIKEGVKPGDIFAIVTKGVPVYIPGTKKILGYQEKLIAKCQVNSVDQGSAQCISYYSAGKASGDLKALRYTKVRAAFFLNDRLVSPVFSTYSLKEILPNLDWIEPSSGPLPVASESSMKAFGIDLIFRLRDHNLLVYGPGMKKLSTYEVSSWEEVPASTGSQGAHVEAAPVVVDDAPLVFDFSHAEVVGSLKDKVIQLAVADLNGDGLHEVVYLTEKGLGLVPYRREGPASFYRFEDFECPCNFSIFKDWLVLNVAIENAGLSSKLFRYKDGMLQIVQDEINLWLAFSPVDCGSNQKVFLGQEYEKERFRGQKIFVLRPTLKGIEYEKQAELPNDFNIQSALAVKINNVCTLLYVSFDGFFKVFAKGAHLWTSLFPVVEDRRCCGPAQADFIAIRNGVIFNGMVPAGSKGLNQGVYYFPFNKGHGFLRADKNLNGRPVGMSLIKGALLIGVTLQEKGDWETQIYKFILDK